MTSSSSSSSSSPLLSPLPLPKRKHKRKQMHKDSFFKSIFKSIFKTLFKLFLDGEYMIFLKIVLIISVTFTFQKPIYTCLNTTIALGQSVSCLFTPLDCAISGAQTAGGWIGGFFFKREGEDGGSQSRGRNGGDGNRGWNEGGTGNNYYKFSYTPTYPHQSQYTYTNPSKSSQPNCNLLNLEEKFFLINPPLFTSSLYQNKHGDLDMKSELNHIIQSLVTTLSYIPDSTSSSSSVSPPSPFLKRTSKSNRLKEFLKDLIELRDLVEMQRIASISYFEIYIHTSQDLQHITYTSMRNIIKALADLGEAVSTWQKQKCERKRWFSWNNCANVKQRMKKEVEDIQMVYKIYFKGMRDAVKGLETSGREMLRWVEKGMEKRKKIFKGAQGVGDKLRMVRYEVGEMVWRDLMMRFHDFLPSSISFSEYENGKLSTLESWGEKMDELTMRLKNSVKEIEELGKNWYVLPLGKEGMCFFPEIWGSEGFEGVGEWIVEMRSWCEERERFLRRVGGRVDGWLIGESKREG